MKIAFQINDIRGRKVVCTEECWYSHILDEHQDMEGFEEEVKEAIQNPYPLPCVYQDRDYPSRHIYYRLFRTKKYSYYIKAIVDFSEPDEGELITAFKTDSPKTGELMIWPESHA